MRTWALTIALLALVAVPGVAAAKTTVATNKVMVVRWWRGSTPKTTTTTTSGTAKVGAPKVTLPKVPSPKLPAPKVPKTAVPVVKPLPKTVTSGTTLKKTPTPAGQTRLPQPRTRVVVRWAHSSSIAVLKSALGNPGIHREREADLGSAAHVDGSREPSVEPLRQRPVPAPAQVERGSISRRRSTRVVLAAPPSQIKLLDHQMELLQMTEALQ
jgi:hypothetical protein